MRPWELGGGILFPSFPRAQIRQLLPNHVRNYRLHLRVYLVSTHLYHRNRAYVAPIINASKTGISCCSISCHPTLKQPSRRMLALMVEASGTAPESYDLFLVLHQPSNVFIIPDLYWKVNH